MRLIRLLLATTRLKVAPWCLMGGRKLAEIGERLMRR
jgi:hypothetical protein